MYSSFVPCIYFHAEMKDALTDQQQNELREALIGIVSKQFTKYFGTNIIVEIQIEQGSLKAKIWLNVTYVAVVLTLFINVPKIPSTFRQYVRTAQTQVIPFVKEQFKDYGLKQIICCQKRTGLIGELDEVIRRHEEGIITYNEYMKKAIDILEEINKSPDRKKIIKALVKYIDAIYKDFPWDDLKNQTHNDTAVIPKNERMVIDKPKRDRYKLKSLKR